MTPEEQKKLDSRLIDAALDGHTEVVKAHLAAGANVHAEDDKALRWAAVDGHTETVRTLLAAGADVHARNDGALSLGALYGCAETVKILLATGADLHATDDIALRLAAGHGHTEAVKILLSAGSDVHAGDDEALRFAAYNDNAETVQVLTNHIFAPDAWRGKSRAEIEAEANALYNKIKADNPQPDRLRTAGAILLDCGLTCWEQVRPAPPKIQISPLPAQPRPL
jgi:ankyrin repeat protein